MSGSFSTYLETALLNHVFVDTNFPAPLAIFVAAFSQAPDASGAGAVEITDPGYGRFSVTFAQASGVPPSCLNTLAIQWAPATQPWSVIACGLYDAPNSGNYLGGNHLVDPVTGAWAPKSLDPGDVFRIPIGGLSVGFWTPAPPVLPLVSPMPPVAAPRGRVMPIAAEVIIPAPLSMLPPRPPLPPPPIETAAGVPRGYTMPSAPRGAR